MRFGRSWSLTRPKDPVDHPDDSGRYGGTVKEVDALYGTTITRHHGNTVDHGAIRREKESQLQCGAETKSSVRILWTPFMLMVDTVGAFRRASVAPPMAEGRNAASLSYYHTNSIRFPLLLFQKCTLSYRSGSSNGSKRSGHTLFQTRRVSEALRN